MTEINDSVFEEESKQKRKPPMRKPLSKEHISKLLGFRELIASGYYNTDAVIEDLSESMTNAVCVYI